MKEPYYVVTAECGATGRRTFEAPTYREAVLAFTAWLEGLGRDLYNLRVDVTRVTW